MTEPEACDRRCHNTIAGAICDPCYADTWADLCALPGLWDRAHDELAGGSATNDRVSGSRERPLGANVTALSWIAPARHDAAPGAMLNPDDQTGPLPLADVLTSWARAISDELPAHAPGARATWYGATIDELADHLARHFGHATSAVWADDFAEEIRDAAAHGRGITREYGEPSGHRDGVRCPTCDTLTLYLRPGARFTECEVRAGGCGRMWSPAEWAELVGDRAALLVEAGLVPPVRRLLDLASLAAHPPCICGGPYADHRRPDGVPGVGKPSYRCPSYSPRPTEGENRMTTDDLAAWLREQIAEDRRAASEAEADRDDDWWWGPDSESASERHIARWDPDRVLAECDAKERILAAHRVEQFSPRPGVPHTVGCFSCHIADATLYAGGYCDTLRALALPYADRPGYREEWRP